MNFYVFMYLQLLTFFNFSRLLINKIDLRQLIFFIAHDSASISFIFNLFEANNFECLLGNVNWMYVLIIISILLVWYNIFSI